MIEGVWREPVTYWLVEENFEQIVVEGGGLDRIDWLVVEVLEIIEEYDWLEVVSISHVSIRVELSLVEFPRLSFVNKRVRGVEWHECRTCGMHELPQVYSDIGYPVGSPLHLLYHNCPSAANFFLQILNPPPEWSQSYSYFEIEEDWDQIQPQSLAQSAAARILTEVSKATILTKWGKMWLPPCHCNIPYPYDTMQGRLLQEESNHIWQALITRSPSCGRQNFVRMMCRSSEEFRSVLQ